MHLETDNPAKLAIADPAQWPIQIRQNNYGWTVTLYNRDGHAKYVLTAGSEMEAYREAHNLAKTNHVMTPVLLTTNKGNRKVDLDRLLRSRKKV